VRSCGFFAYIALEAYSERNDPCDANLGTFLAVLGIYGFLSAYFDFLFEKFAKIETQTRLRQFMPVLWGLNIVLTIVWGAYGAHEMSKAETCRVTSKDIYRISWLFVLGFYVVCALVALAFLLAALDYLCNGHLRVVVLVDPGTRRSEDDDDD